MATPGIERWTGLVMIGDGLAGLIWPREYLRKLEVGPKLINDVLEVCAQRPVLTRTLCVLEIALGAWIFTGRGLPSWSASPLQDGKLPAH